MIPDHGTDTVFISDLLPRRFAGVHKALEAALGNGLHLIPGARDLWCRDFMPVQVTPDRFVQFRYDPGYLKGHPGRRTPDGAGLLGLKNCVDSNLIIDGGNVVCSADTAIVTDKVYEENPGVAPRQLRQELRRLLEVDRLVVIPTEPGDVCGHSDGVLRFVGRDILLVNDYGRVDRAYGPRLEAALKAEGLQTIPFPYRPTDKAVDGIPSAEGVFINFLQTSDTILVPAFGLADDGKAAETLAQLFPHYRVHSVPCLDLASEGGVLNCATWTVRATPALLAGRSKTG